MISVQGLKLECFQMEVDISAPFLSNTAQPQPVGQFKHTFYQKLEISVIVVHSKYWIEKCCLIKASNF